MKIMINALRAIFALCERIVMHLLSLNAQNTHIDFMLRLRRDKL